MTVLNLVLGGTIFTEGGHYSPVNVLGGQYSLVNNVRGDILGGDTVHYDTGVIQMDLRHAASASDLHPFLLASKKQSLQHLDL